MDAFPQTIENLKTRAISKRGGARQGAGRKPKLQYEARELFNMTVDEKWPLIVEKIDGWVKDGDKDIIKFLIEQRIGKPSQSLDIEKKEISVSYSQIFKPEVREAIRVLDNKIKEELRKE